MLDKIRWRVRLRCKKDFPPFTAGEYYWGYYFQGQDYVRVFLDGGGKKDEQPIKPETISMEEMNDNFLVKGEKSQNVLIYTNKNQQNDGTTDEDT